MVCVWPPAERGESGHSAKRAKGDGRQHPRGPGTHQRWYLSRFLRSYSSEPAKPCPFGLEPCPGRAREDLSVMDDIRMLPGIVRTRDRSRGRRIVACDGVRRWFCFRRRQRRRAIMCQGSWRAGGGWCLVDSHSLDRYVCVETGMLEMRRRAQVFEAPWSALTCKIHSSNSLVRFPAPAGRLVRSLCMDS
jgi:hypothetical protein